MSSFRTKKKKIKRKCHLLRGKKKKKKNSVDWSINTMKKNESLEGIINLINDGHLSKI